jgi:hypothetical protein
MDDSESGLRKDEIQVMIIGVVCGALAFMVLGFLLGMWLRHRWVRKKKDNNSPSPPPPYAPPDPTLPSYSTCAQYPSGGFGSTGPTTGEVAQTESTRETYTSWYPVVDGTSPTYGFHPALRGYAQAVSHLPGVL